MINYYEVEISGKSIERFFSKIIRNKINILDIKYNKNSICFKVSYNDYIKITKLNTIYNIRIINIRGISKIKNMLNFYYIFFSLLLLSIIWIFIYSKMIFFVDINTENNVLKQNIENNYKNYGLNIYSFSKSYNELQEISKNIKNDFKNDIEWIEIKHIGVKYEINIIEKINLNNKKVYEYNDIVAAKNGLILDVYSKTGEIIKNKGDYVNKGEVIVSGLIKKNDEVKNTVSADAKVFAEVWYKVSIEHPLAFNEQINNKGYKNIALSIFNKDIILFSQKNKRINKEKEVLLINNSLFKLKSIHKYQKNLIKKKYTKKELQKKLENIALTKVSEQLKENEKILLQKTLKIVTNNDKMNIEVFFKVYEDIAMIKKINLGN